MLERIFMTVADLYNMAESNKHGRMTVSKTATVILKMPLQAVVDIL